MTLDDPDSGELLALLIEVAADGMPLDKAQVLKFRNAIEQRITAPGRPDAAVA